MSDAVVLLAISQLVCLGGLAYLYAQVMKLRAQNPAAPTRSTRVRPMPFDVDAVPAEDRVHRSRPAAPATFDVAQIARRMNETGVDIPALARRMHRSEDEVRLLLRRQGAA